MFKPNYFVVTSFVVVVIFLAIIRSTDSDQVSEPPKSNISIKPVNQNADLASRTSSKSDTTNQLTGLSVDLTEVKSGLSAVPLKAADMPNNNPEPPIELARHGEILCQPQNFDPKIRQFEKIIDPNLIPVEFYETTDVLDFGRFRIDEPKNLTLPEPLKITQYIFGCGAIEDAVVEVQASGERIYLFQGVKDYLTQQQISKNGKFLYLDFYSLVDKKYISKKIVVNLVTQKIVDLSSFGCSTNGFWGTENLFTFVESRAASSPKPAETNAQNINICIFDQNGGLKDAFSYKTISQIASGNLYTDIKLDSIDDYLGLYSGSVLSNGPQSCILSVYNLKTKTLKEAIVGQADQSGTCPVINILKLEENRAVLNFK